MMKKITLLCFSIIVFMTVACSKSTADNASPETLYKQNNSIDMLVYNKIAYVKASDIDWVKEVELTNSKELGEIQRTDITMGFENLDATVLEVRTKVYSVLERDDFVLVYINDSWIPYYAYVEG